MPVGTQWRSWCGVPHSSLCPSPPAFRDGGKETWEVPVGASHKILVEWGAEFDNFDPVTQVWGRMGQEGRL